MISQFNNLMLSSNEAQFGRYAANRLLRTETNYVVNMAQAKAYKKASIEKYRFVAVLDVRTSEVCREKDGKEYYLKDKISNS
jgi:SPP1 gp7 family putative phage head morphogenesis protein